MLNPSGILKSGKDKEREAKMTDLKKLEELFKIKTDQTDPNSLDM